MSDPRQEDRLRGPMHRGSILPTQVDERIRLALSPVDDELPFAQAIRQAEEMKRAAKAFADRMKGRAK